MQKKNNKRYVCAIEELYPYSIAVVNGTVKDVPECPPTLGFYKGDCYAFCTRGEYHVILRQNEIEGVYNPDSFTLIFNSIELKGRTKFNKYESDIAKKTADTAKACDSLVQKTMVLLAQCPDFATSVTGTIEELAKEYSDWPVDELYFKLTNHHVNSERPLFASVRGRRTFPSIWRAC